MARLNVNPTRMVLTNLKKQMKVAVRGHKLMKDKRDELMKRFLELARENKRLREEVEAQLMEVYASFSIASAVMTPAMMEEALMYPKQGVSLTVGSKNIMSVDVPVFDFETENGAGAEGNVFPLVLPIPPVNWIPLLRSFRRSFRRCWSWRLWRRRPGCFPMRSKRPAAVSMRWSM